MTSDETPREPQEGDRARSTGSTGSTNAGTPVSASQQWSGPPGPSRGSGDGQNGTSAEPRPQTWSSPPDGGGESRAPGRLPASTRIVALIGATAHAVALTLILALTLPIVTMASLTGSAGLLIVAPVVALVLTVFLFWAFRRMLAAARFPRPTAAMVLFTTVVFAAFVWNVALQSAFGTGEPAEGILTAGVITAPLAALVMLMSRGARVRWAAAVSAVVLVVAGVAAWAQSREQEESMLERQRQTNLEHEDEAAVLDAGGWEPYRSEINDAAHGTGDASAGEGSTDGAGGEEWLSVFTVFYQDGNGGYLRTATWADERTAEDPEAVLRGWCDGEGAYCQDLEAEEADGPVVAQWSLGGTQYQDGAEGSQGPEEPGELGAPESVRYEYEPGRVVYLGPWTQEPDRSQGGGPGAGPDGSDGGDPAGETSAEQNPGTAHGHDDFEARELAEWATQVRPAQEEDLVDLADRTVEYFQGPEDVLTGP